MNPDTDQDCLWAGISGIPVSTGSAAGGFKLILDGTVSLYGKIPDRENMVNFSALNRVISSATENGSCDQLEFFPELLVKAALTENTKLQGARCEVSGRLVFRDRKGRNFETLVNLSYSNGGGESRFDASLKARGITACPCSMGKIRSKLKERYPEHGKSIEEIPQITHNQRVSMTVIVSMKKSSSNVLLALLKICEDSLGNLLSHNQSENEVNEMLLAAHESPLLIEEVARRGSEFSIRRLGENAGLINSAKVICESEESIHSYNARAEKSVRF